MNFEMTVSAAGHLQCEIEANARMCGTTPAEFLASATHVMAILGHRRASLHDGIFAIQQGIVTAGLATDGNLAIFRGGVGLRMHEGITLGDLGGVPLDGLRARITVTYRILARAAIYFGTSDPGETCGFLVWSFLRLMNGIREDFPGGTLGVASPRGQEFIPVYGPSASDPKVWGMYLSPPEHAARNP